MEDTELIVALGRQQRRPQLPQHRRRMLQCIHQLLVVLWHKIRHGKGYHTSTTTLNWNVVMIIITLGGGEQHGSVTFFELPDLKLKQVSLTTT